MYALEWVDRVLLKHGYFSCMFLGALLPRDGLCDKEIRRRIGMGKAAVGGLTNILKDRGIKLATKVKMAKACSG